METLRHVITQCKATSANREMAVGMHRECFASQLSHRGAHGRQDDKILHGLRVFIGCLDLEKT